MHAIDTALVTLPEVLSALGAATDCKLAICESKRISPEEPYIIACELIPHKTPTEYYANVQFREKIYSVMKALSILPLAIIIEKFSCSDQIGSRAFYAHFSNKFNKSLFRSFRAFLKEIDLSYSHVTIDFLLSASKLPKISTIILDNCLKIYLDKSLALDSYSISKTVNIISLVGIVANRHFRNIFNLFPNITNVFITIQPPVEVLIDVNDLISMERVKDTDIPYPCGHLTEKFLEKIDHKECLRHPVVLKRQDVCITKVGKVWQIVFVDVLKRKITSECQKWLHLCHALYITEPVIGKSCSACSKEFTANTVQKVFFDIIDTSKEFTSFVDAFDYLVK